jgi:hypothetical protein
VILPVLNIPRANVHYIIFVASARAQHYDSLTGWTTLRAPARPPNATVHAGAATRHYTPEKLLLSSLLSLAGAINNFFMVYPQKYKNCSTLCSKWITKLGTSRSFLLSLDDLHPWLVKPGFLSRTTVKASLGDAKFTFTAEAATRLSNFFHETDVFFLFRLTSHLLPKDKSP